MKITDFGLAKLLAYNEGEYHAAGGKVSNVIHVKFNGVKGSLLVLLNLLFLSNKHKVFVGFYRCPLNGLHWNPFSTESSHIKQMCGPTE